MAPGLPNPAPQCLSPEIARSGVCHRVVIWSRTDGLGSRGETPGRRPGVSRTQWGTRSGCLRCCLATYATAERTWLRDSDSTK